MPQAVSLPHTYVTSTACRAINHNINSHPDVHLAVQKEEAERLKSYNKMMEAHEKRMAGLML